MSSVGTWNSVPTFTTQTVTTPVTTTVPFPSTTVGGTPLAIAPLAGTVQPNPTNRPGFNAIRGLFATATAGGVSSVNVNIQMSVGAGISVPNLQRNLANNIASTFGYSGTVNVNVTPVGSGAGNVTVSSPGRTMTVTRLQTRQIRVQTGTQNVLTP